MSDAAQALFDDYDRITEGCHGDPTMLSYVNEDLLWATLTGFADALRAALAAGPPSREQVRQAIVSAKAYEQVEAATDAVMALLAQPSDPPCSTCGGKGLVSLTGRGSDGPDPCPDCGPSDPPTEADEETGRRIAREAVTIDLLRAELAQEQMERSDAERQAEEARTQRDAYRALLDEILDWLACSKWAVDNQKATEWGLRIREIEADRG